MVAVAGGAKPKKDEGGQRYQVQVQAILIGSKESGQRPSISAKDLGAQIAAKLPLELGAKDFSSGNKGFFGQFKVEVAD